MAKLTRYIMVQKRQRRFVMCNKIELFDIDGCSSCGEDHLGVKYEELGPLMKQHHKCDAVFMCPTNNVLVNIIYESTSVTNGDDIVH